MIRRWRPLGRVLAVVAFVVFIGTLTFFTTSDVELVPLERTSASDVVEFASFQSAVVRILSRKTEGKLDMVLSVDSADIEELIQEHRSASATPAPFPMEAELILNNPDVCRNSPDLEWIVYVHTSCRNSERRDLLRRTWANTKLFKDHSFKVIFLMGKASTDLQEDLRKEFDQYGDIVQGNFMDEYKNLTLKAVMGLRWIKEFCPHVPYVMKTDDDSFINIFEIIRMMKENRGRSNVIMCPLWQNHTMPILRDRKTCMKWCVKRRDLPGMRFFPQYCAGIAYILSRQLVRQMYEASKSTPFFWIDDVYVTGLLTKKVPDKIDYIDLNRRMTLKEDLALESYTNKSHPIAYDIIHVHEKSNFIALWNALLDRLTDSQKMLLQQDIQSYKA